MKPALGHKSSEVGERRRHQVALSRQSQILLAMRYREMSPAQRAAVTFDDVGFNVFSQTNEDGILLYVFSLIGLTNRRCVDIGAGAVQGSSVANLLVHHGFDGLLIDGSRANVEACREFYGAHPETEAFPPVTVPAFVTAENINGVLTENGFTGPIDLLAIDIDGVDYWIWKALEVVQPRVVVVEHQGILGPRRAWTVPYSPDFDLHDYEVNDGHYNYCGASLAAFVKLGRQKDYRLVGCSRGGWNAFFVRSGLNEQDLPEVETETCFRYRWREFDAAECFRLVEHMNWVEV